MKMTLLFPRKLRSDVLNWLESLRVEDTPYGTYKMSKSTEATLFPSCFAVFVGELYDDLKNITRKQRQEWTNLISNAQDEKDWIIRRTKAKRTRIV